MNELQIFKNELFEVAVKLDNGEFVFDVEQVAKCLGITDTKNNKEYVRWNRVNEYLPKNSPLVAKGDFIPEPLVYKLAFKANNEIAEKFQDWLAIDVIPSIRKNGGYIATNEDDTDEDILARAVLVAQKSIEKKNQIIAAQQKQLEEQQPLVSFARICMQSTESIKVGELAKMMVSHGIETGQNRLFIKLREWGLVFKSSTEPTQKAVESGYFEIAQGVKQKPNGEAFTWRTPYVTPKGQMYIANRLQKEATA
ncbi:phage antirepressor KilAC domain-containing protein [Bacillus sp. UNC438CL73TsuS30]|uniref:phage antirepressor KilAC domain-containing protein n=1 Tax=Bacillus sp. UNC438CL73TsuS30 TaxID=1340434 RepID=UPI00047C4EB5|nr:phage antirepressor KilAC domain-containing protein [Bacillus sp. UNC438CL73TsuS30]